MYFDNILLVIVDVYYFLWLIGVIVFLFMCVINMKGDIMIKIFLDYLISI